MSQRCLYCCKSRKSIGPENLAKVDFWTPLPLQNSPRRMRGPVVSFVRNDVVPHIGPCETHQRSFKFSFFTRKRPFQQYPPEADAQECGWPDSDLGQSQSINNFIGTAE